jgi:haloacetate dehalogenase
MSDYPRRDLLKQAAALGVGAVAVASKLIASTEAAFAQADSKPAPVNFFPSNFTQHAAKTSGATINFVTAGSGPPVLLLHGYPQTHIMWRKVAPQLAQKFTVVAADLRGYGDSSKPPDGENHFGHSKRAMAQDQVEVMASLGFQKFAVVGHDRGGRVAHRMALDHADRVTSVTVLDIVPTYKLFHNVTKEWATSSYHWFFLLQKAPFPETLIANSAELYLRSRFDRLPPEKLDKDAFLEYLRCFRDPATIHGSSEDYRAAASIDLDHDAADLDKKVQCPFLVLWGAHGESDRLFDVLATWRERAANVSGRTLPSGHFIAEQVPELLVPELMKFLS